MRGRHSSNVPARGVTVQNAGARFYNVAWRYGRALADAVARNSITEKIQKVITITLQDLSCGLKKYTKCITYRNFLLWFNSIFFFGNFSFIFFHFFQIFFICQGSLWKIKAVWLVIDWGQRGWNWTFKAFVFRFAIPFGLFTLNFWLKKKV